jgi:hypothetical protein
MFDFGIDGWLLFWIEFQSLELTYLPIFKGYDDNGVFSFTWKFMVSKI